MSVSRFAKALRNIFALAADFVSLIRLQRDSFVRVGRRGDVNELRKAYEGFHPDVRAVLEACPDCHKWAILEREPLPRWSDGRVVLLGDACHPMTPYMAQGGATAIEDAAILARCIEKVDGEDIEGAFQRYEAHRKPRTSRIQAISSANTWMKGGDEDTSWLYGYDAWNVPLTPMEPFVKTF